MTIPTKVRTYDDLIAKMLASYDNLVIDGPAGSGKSHLIRRFTNQTSKKTLLTASTALAASHIGGMSLHSALGLGPRTPLGGVIKPSQLVIDLVQSLDTLLIDEVGMVTSHLLDHVDALFRFIRGNNRPLGGVRLILVGDAYQLGPVIGTEEKRLLNIVDSFYTNRSFFFQSKLFEDPTFIDQLRVYSLVGNFRHGADSDYKQLLDRVRIGEPTDEDIRRLNTRYLAHDDSGIPVICLTNKAVNFTNHAVTAGRRRWWVIPQRVTGEGSDSEIESSDELGRFAVSVGSRVMATQNIDGMKNGSLGTVLSVLGAGMAAATVTVRFDSGETAEVTWKLLETYVPVLDQVSRSARWEVSGSVMTLPLRPAAAFTSHRAQGMTIPRVWVDPEDGRAMAGQIYTALSRVPSLDALGLLGRLEREYVQASDEVKAFFRRTPATLVHPA